MNKIKMVVIALGLAMVMSACSMTLPHSATGNEIGNKVGRAKITVYLGAILFPFEQDAGIRAAAKNGGITRISTVDVKTTNLFNIIVTYETIVTGS
jgi:hypothetical protein